MNSSIDRTVSSDMADPITCLALVKPRSVLAREWNLERPSYCIYEFDPSYEDGHQIRWGDGSWQNLSEDHFDSLVLLPEFANSDIDDILEG
ncbi:MAG: hypothetical protein ABW139_05725 [Candidatus Thiodiazotropha sp. DIVDIV]